MVSAGRPRRTTDVFIVGGGPAGLAAGIAAREQGLDVMVADGAPPPIDKVGGEGVTPNGVEALRSLGVEIRRHDAVSVRGIRFIVSGLRAEATFAGEPGCGIRRTTLHRLLVERAAAVGVRLHWQTRVLGLIPGGVLSDAGPVACRWIVGADGERSQVRRWVGLTPARPPVQRFGFRRHFRVTPWTDLIEVHWCRGAQVFVTPVSAGEVCVALISRDPRVRLRSLIEVCPDLARRLGRAPASTPEWGAISAARRLPAVTRGRVALIGDASGSVDANTGEGLSPIFQHALALADALSSGDLRSYEASHRRIVRTTPAFMARLLLAMDRSPWLRRRALRAFTVEPGLFSRLLALHVDGFTPPRRAVGSFCTLGWRLLTA